MKFYKVILVSLFLVLFVYPALSDGDIAQKIKGEGAGTAENPYLLPKAAAPIKIDGKLEDKEWESALKLDLPYETWPGENIKAPVRTECYISYTNSYLYVAFRAFDPHPKRIRAFYFERDKFLFDDFVAIFLDTFNDERFAYGFRCNALGLQWDDIRTRTKAAQAHGVPVAWDAIYDSAGKIYDWGYAVEMAIPFNQLRFQRTREDQVWGFNVRRIYPRKWLQTLDHVPMDRNNYCLMCQYAKIKGLKGIKPGRNIELVPTVTGLRTDERTNLPDGEFEKRNEDLEAGLTARWGLATNLTLNGTVNPDFSQVEADALKLDINEPFALFYEERRPFFYEGDEYFKTDFSAVYTRMMRDPTWGIKLAGKEGAHTIGAYVVRDDITNLVFPGSHDSTKTSLDFANTSSVFRYKIDLGSNYTLGALGTDREGGDYFNRLFGFDGNFRITKKDRVQFQFLGSSTRYPDEVAEDFAQEQGDFFGSAFDFSYTRDTRNWDFSAEIQNLTEGFRADLGYMPQVNYRQGNLGTSYTWIGGRKKWYRELRLGGQYSYSADQDGNLIYNGGALTLSYRGRLQSYLDFTAKEFRETYSGLEFDQFQFNTYFQTRPIRGLEFIFISNIGDRIDYSNVRPGKRIYLASALVLKPGTHMLLELSHVYERLRVEGDRLYTANVSYLKAAYHFNVRTFLRAILQYVDYDFNVDLYTYPMYPEYKLLTTQFLFTYRINPRTLFFLGYSDNYYGRVQYPLTQNDWTVFAKISYAWSL